MVHETEVALKREIKREEEFDGYGLIANRLNGVKVEAGDCQLVVEMEHLEQVRESQRHINNAPKLEDNDCKLAIEMEHLDNIDSARAALQQKQLLQCATETAVEVKKEPNFHLVIEMQHLNNMEDADLILTGAESITVDEEASAPIDSEGFIANNEIAAENRTDEASRGKEETNLFLKGFILRDGKYDVAETPDGSVGFGTYLKGFKLAGNGSYEAIESKDYVYITTSQKIEGVNVFTCDICCKSYKTKKTLGNHKYSTHNGRQYTCKTCGVSFKRGAHLRKHEESHLEKSFHCKICPRSFVRLKRLQEHVQGIHLNRSPYRCNICDKGYATRDGYNTHMRTHTNQDDLRCKVCLKTVSSKTTLRRHMVVHTTGVSAWKKDTQPLRCNICDRTFEWKQSLKKHLASHTGEKVKCDVCGLMVQNLKSHRLTHKKGFECKVCHKEFYAPGRLKEHEAMHSGVTLYNCFHCRKGFNRKNRLTRHMRVHMGIAWKCAFCPEEFESDYRLKTHLLVHSESVKTISCPMCSKRFITKSQFERHNLTHINENDENALKFECEQCHKCFRGKMYLRSHIGSVHAAKKHKCEVCDKAFGKRSQKLQHMRIHLHLKPFTCKTCERLFFTEENYKLHVLTHTGESVYFECYVCQKRFHERAALRAHTKVHLKKKTSE